MSRAAVSHLFATTGNAFEAGGFASDLGCCEACPPMGARRGRRPPCTHRAVRSAARRPLASIRDCSRPSGLAAHAAPHTAAPATRHTITADRKPYASFANPPASHRDAWRHFVPQAARFRARGRTSATAGAEAGRAMEADSRPDACAAVRRSGLTRRQACGRVWTHHAPRRVPAGGRASQQPKSAANPPTSTPSAENPPTSTPHRSEPAAASLTSAGVLLQELLRVRARLGGDGAAGQHPREAPRRARRG